MDYFFSVKRWLAFWVTIGFCCWGSWFSPTVALPTTPPLAPELLNFPNWPLHQFPSIPCTTELQTQFNDQAKIPFTCELGEMLPAEKILAIGNFANMGLTQVSLWQIANLNGLDLNHITADQLRNFYHLITPNKLLGDRFNDFYPDQVLADLPLIREALIQDLLQKFQMNDWSQLGPLNNLIEQYGGTAEVLTNDLDNIEGLRQQLSKLPLGKVVAALPSFGNYSLANLSLETLQAFSVDQAILGLADQQIGGIAGVESLMVGDFGAIGLPNISLSQMPKPISLVPGIKFGRFDLPLGDNEKNPRRHLAGGLPAGDHQLRKLSCRDQCKFAEIAVPNTDYHGAAWVDGSQHWVPDGFGFICGVWPGGCQGPAGNNPYGDDLRVLLTNIDAATGTAQVSITLHICWDVWFLGTTCTPSVFPIPSGFPIYTIREGEWLPFIVPINYNDS